MSQTHAVSCLCRSLCDPSLFSVASARRYRGEVRSVSSDHYLVHFIDWGNSERVSPTAVAPLPSGLDAAPPQAVLAALPWRPAGADGAWSDAQWVGLRALDGVPLTASLVGTEPAVSVALFNADGKSMLSVMGDGARTGQPAVQADGEDGDMTLPPQPEVGAVSGRGRSRVTDDPGSDGRCCRISHSVRLCPFVSHCVCMGRNFI